MQIRTKESRKRLQSLILLTAFTCVLLIVSTYAWFTVQKDVNVSNIRAKVEVAEGLQISLDGAKWTQVLDLGNALDSADTNYQAPNASLDPAPGETFTYMPYEGHRNHVPEEFLPISTSADYVDVDADELSANNNSQELGMYAGKYDGDETTKLGNIIRADEEKTAVSDADYAGYYAFDIFLKNTSKTGVTKDTLQLNSDAYAWVLPEGENITVDGVSEPYRGDAASGLQNAIRIAFARYGEGETNADESNIVKATAKPSEVLSGTKDDLITDVAIWEPNHNDHVERIIENIGPKFTTTPNPLPTDKDYKTATPYTYTPFWSGTLSKDLAGSPLTSVFNWEVSGIKRIPTLQTTTTIGEDLLNGFTVEGVQNLISAKTTTKEKPDDPDGEYKPFTLAANAVTKLRVYVYLEGQDPDCDTTASQGGGIEVNIGLTKGEAQGSMDRYNEIYTDPAVTSDDRGTYSGGSLTGTADPS